MSHSDEIAISIKNISKNFKLPHQKADSIKSLFVNPLSIFGQKQNVEVQHALNGVTFDIKKGEFFGIVGRNGSGKSTLLKILAGIYRPTDGSVSVVGKLVPFIELGVGFNPELTGRENVYLSCALNGFSERETSEMYEDIVDFAELRAFMDQKLKNYSSGMQVRLAFSVATRSRADILLIDEVLAVGDADFQRKCFNYFKSLKKAGTTVVFVSHDMDAVREYCDRAALIENNQLIDVDNSEAISQQYTKLFVENVSESTTGTEQNRWGRGGVKTESVEAKIDEKMIIITQVIRAQEKTDAFVAGIRIRSFSGTSVSGTNSKIENVSLGKMDKGDTATIKWKMSNVLADGSYYVDAAINGPDGITVYDWWDEAAIIPIKKNRAVPYLIDSVFEAELL